MSDSIFSKIINRELSATIRHEDDEFIVIDDIHPKAPIHILIIPKKAYRTLEEVEMNDDAFYAKLLKLARLMAKKLGTADNYKLFMNVGDKVQDVSHLHLHLMGGYEGSRGRFTFKENA